MHKTMLIITLCLIVSCASLEPIPESERTFGRVIEAPGYTRDQIFDASRMWIAENFKSAQRVIEYEDRATGSVVGNGVISYPCKADTLDCLGRANDEVAFTMRIDTKDGRVKTSFSNIKIFSYGTDGRLVREGNMALRSEADAIKPDLLKFGDEILSVLQKNKADW